MKFSHMDKFRATPRFKREFRGRPAGHGTLRILQSRIRARCKRSSVCAREPYLSLSYVPKSGIRIRRFSADQILRVSYKLGRVPCATATEGDFQALLTEKLSLRKLHWA